MNIEEFNSFGGNKRVRIKVFTLNNLLFLFLIYFSYFGINGSNGFLNLIKLKDELRIVKDEFDVLRKEEVYLKLKNRGLYIETLDTDILEEESKRILGYADINEIVILTSGE